MELHLWETYIHQILILCGRVYRGQSTSSSMWGNMDSQMITQLHNDLFQIHTKIHMLIKGWEDLMVKYSFT